MNINKYYFLTTGLIALDQLTKLLVYTYIPLRDSIVINILLNITHVHNDGAAFSFLTNSGGWQIYFLSSVSFIASAVIVVWMKKTHPLDKLKLSALSLILTGAIGNLIDRLVFGFVIDFIDIHYKNFYWPVFNIADSIITIGVILLIFSNTKFNG